MKIPAIIQQKKASVVLMGRSACFRIDPTYLMLDLFGIFRAVGRMSGDGSRSRQVVMGGNDGAVIDSADKGRVERSG